MREILFRAKPFRPDAPYFVKNPHVLKDGFIYGHLGAMDSAGTCSITPLEIPEGQILRPSFKVISETVGQFTGLVDSNGTKIFEGDILNTEYGRTIGYVVYKNGCFSVQDSHSLHRPAIDIVMAEHSVDVIGNIHDNPELLEDVNNENN